MASWSPSQHRAPLRRRPVALADPERFLVEDGAGRLIATAPDLDGAQTAARRALLVEGEPGPLFVSRASDPARWERAERTEAGVVFSSFSTLAS